MYSLKYTVVFFLFVLVVRLSLDAYKRRKILQMKKENSLDARSEWEEDTTPEWIQFIGRLKDKDQ